MGTKTAGQYDLIINECREIYLKKIKDYGASWRVLRTRSLTDQVLIKARRIKNIEETGVQKVLDGIEDEYKGIINYCLIALIQTELGAAENTRLSESEAKKLFEAKAKETKELMLAKNHDYGEAWREMRGESFTDMILMKLMRLKQIEDNNGQTLISEGAPANYMDIINYAVFALIKMKEQ